MKRRMTNPLRWERDGDCIICTSHKPNSNGYPVIDWGDGTGSRPICRLVLFRSYGEQPYEVVARHTCDNRLCINPDHIIPGSTKENARDRMFRGRNADKRGTLNGRAKVTEEMVRFIRTCAGTTAIAKQLGLSPSTVKRIKSYKTWRHVR